jgi:hypothetical protein
MRFLLSVLLTIGLTGAVRAQELPIFDAHIHYSHDAWDVMPPKAAIEQLRKAGVRRALVSSSNDDGTQKLLAEAPDIVVPELRPYRRRGELATWTRDPSIIPYLEERLAKFRYVAIGEFHVYGAEVEQPVVQRVIQMAKQRGIMLHAHSDADAVERIFKADPGARVLWAHAGFARPEEVAKLLAKHKSLWADLAFRTDHGQGGKVPPEWRSVFEAFPDRFMIGTDTFTPERWHYVGEHARWSREWLKDLPKDLAERIAWKNADSLFPPAAAAGPVR